ncbi:hypothetical protein ASG95_06105 [Phycicoccus sp. Soil803]|nr:hypothetical protein ASG95_06105 [Phycicoccus sp. Soil803]
MVAQTQLTSVEPTTTSHATPRHPRPAGRAWVASTAGPGLSAVLSLLVAVQSLRLWDWRPGVPLSLSGDSPQVLMQVRAIMEGGGFGSTDRMGAPFGLNAAWFATGDQLNFAAIRVIGLFTDSPATASAVFFVAGYPAAALAAYWLARQVGIARPAAVTVGVLFSALPGHQRWFQHLWLSAYWVLPLGVWLALQVATGRSVWPARRALRAGTAGRRRAWLHVARTVAIALAVGLSDAYYVAFVLILVGVALVVRWATDRTLRSLLPGVAAAALVGVSCAVSLAFAVVARSGDVVTSDVPAQRTIGESERYAGRLIDLLLPWSEHRLPPLRFITTAYGYAAPPTAERHALGVVSVCGLVVLVLVLLRSVTGGRRPDQVVGALAAFALVSLAFYTRGGLGSVVALFVTPQIRTWARLGTVIALLALLAVGLWMTRVARRRTAAWALAAGVLLVGCLDQTNPGAAPDYARLSATSAQLKGYSAHLAAATSAPCAVFQLPVTPYPEEPGFGQMGDYDHVLPGVAAPSTLTWSYGAIRGTASADWQLALPVDRMAALVPDLRAAGFCAVEVDHRGYVGAADPSDGLASLLGAPLAQTDRLVAFDLATERPDATPPTPPTRDDVLRPVLAGLDSARLQRDDRGRPFQLLGPTATLTVSNLGDTPVPVTLTFSVRTLSGAEDVLVATGLPGAPLRSPISGVDQPVRLEVTAPPGSTKIELASTAEPVDVGGGVASALQLTDLRASSTAGVNVASTQQFFAASPVPSR